jgi:hypothetical protein
MGSEIEVVPQVSGDAQYLLKEAISAVQAGLVGVCSEMGPQDDFLDGIDEPAQTTIGFDITFQGRLMVLRGIDGISDKRWHMLTLDGMPVHNEAVPTYLFRRLWRACEKHLEKQAVEERAARERRRTTRVRSRKPQPHRRPQHQLGHHGPHIACGRRKQK